MLPLDPSQRAVLDLPLEASAVVVGAPGTGKTTVLVELAAARVAAGLSPDELLVIAPSRQTATALRDRLGLRLARVTSGALARTAVAVAFEAVTAQALAEGADQPSLLSGADQDLIIRELLESAADAEWPEGMGAPVRATATFRTELRELMMRATEYDVTPERLAALGTETGRAAWVAAAAFIARYQAIVARARADRLDPAEVTAFAESAIRRGLAGERLARVRSILVDDLQEATEGTLRVLAAFAARGASIVGFGDPDLAANGFRGGRTDAIARFGERVGVPVTRMQLGEVHRHGPGIREAVASVTARIGAAGQGTQRTAFSAVDDGAGAEPVAGGPVRRIVAASAAPLHRQIGRRLRERHLLEGVPWARMAVVVRSGSEVAAFARALAAAQVPTRTRLGGRPVREEVAAAALLRLVEVAIGRVELDGVVAGDLLLGPFGGLDALGLRRLRLAVRAQELENGGTRRADELVAELLAVPGASVAIEHHVSKRAAAVAELLRAVRAAYESGGSPEEVLWTAWDGARVAESWRRQALGAGIAADDANRALDGVVALFTAARRYVEREPEGTTDGFLAEILDSEVPEDTLAPQPDGDAVLVLTPSAAVGIDVDTVVVAGLQEGVWPNLRPRGTLLGAPQLVDLLTGRAAAETDERREVLADELRLYALALSRAERLVVVAAIESEDETPSPFVDLVAPPSLAIRDGAPPLTVRGLTGRLRRLLVAPGERDPQAVRAAAASGLRTLAAAEVPGADPSGWRGLLEPSTTAPLWELAIDDVRVPVSPSKLEEVERSPMEWFVNQVAGGGSGLSANVGTLIHDVMEHATGWDPEQLWDALQVRWGELDFDSPWQAEVQRSAAHRAILALSGYLRAFEAEGALLVGREDGFELDLPPARLTGKIDRVESRDGAIRIVDLKTGSVKTPAEAREHPQLGAYQVAYADGAIPNLPDGHEPGGAALLFTKKGTAKAPFTLRTQEAFDADQLEAFRERVRTAALRMVGPELTATVIDDDWAYGAELRRVHLPGEVSGD